MADNGYPLTTEVSALRDIVLPPSFVSKILSVAGVAGLAKASATPFSSPIPWRKAGLKHNNNEIYFDIIEELEAIVNKCVCCIWGLCSLMCPFRNGNIVSSAVWGKIKSNSRLSGNLLHLLSNSASHHIPGMPDLLLSFQNAQVISDCSFHHCVRYTPLFLVIQHTKAFSRLQRWARDKSLSFVPPDRYFTLMEYRFVPSAGIAAAQPIPVPFTLKPVMNIKENGGSVLCSLSILMAAKILPR